MVPGYFTVSPSTEHGRIRIGHIGPVVEFVGPTPAITCRSPDRRGSSVAGGAEGYAHQHPEAGSGNALMSR